ncbi:glycosyltransferase family 4 protein [Candidatus Uabimicrobium sp. HlEnr_7]|uniref:glycosyltransferase family 4 protein n=1 Tax=Candidatus Uabimicrobium helgolandensis TaxID=3095367 RepID=UPI0035562ECE
MEIGFCLFKYFPFGGLQSDFLAIAKKCQERGHNIHVYTRSWQGEVPQGFHVHLLKTNSISNIGKDVAFIKKLCLKLQKDQPHIVVGFNKIPGLDVYFAADSCYARKVESKPSPIKKLVSRHRHKLRLEASLFQPPFPHLLLIAPQQMQDFEKFYAIKQDNIHMLPPGIDANLKEYSPCNNRTIVKELKLADGTFLILMVGSGFQTKGVDRSIRALSSLPKNLLSKTHLIIAGKGKKAFFVNMAKRLDIEENVTFLGARSDVHSLYQQSDMLLHPSYNESAGKVILEATVVGLPVITTANCGYAFYIEKARNGIVIPAPFDQNCLNKALFDMRQVSDLYERWGKNGWEYARKNDLYTQHDRAVDVIESVGKNKGNARRK